VDPMNSIPQPFQDTVKSQSEQDSARVLDYSYERDETTMDATHQTDQSNFWHQNEALAPPQRGSYLSDLYEEPKSDLAREQQGPSPMPYHTSPSPHLWQENHHGPEHGTAFPRRTSFPFTRHEGGDGMGHGPSYLHAEPGSFLGPYSNRSDAFYREPMSMHDQHMIATADPTALHGHPMEDPYLSSASASPHSSIHEFESVDSAHSSPVIVPTQAPFYGRPGSSSGLPHHPAAFMNPHASLPVMHTDDAASKETQYLRRRCFNCHTTEPPSWRRSTLNPGKIVCNKCGLYERTHLRPRPHRFDELRAGSKARKAAAAAKVAPSPNGSPKAKIDGIKKEPTEGSVTSVGSNGISEWESGSVYSNSSAPNSGYNSPMTSTFPIPGGSLPHSRPSSRDGPIRLPSAPLTDIATRLTKVPPAKSSTAPYYVEGRSTTLATSMPPSSADFYARRGSLPPENPMNSSGTPLNSSSLGMPEVTGWQVIPPSDLTDPKNQKSPRKVAAA
jgi:GATA-binding protein